MRKALALLTAAAASGAAAAFASAPPALAPEDLARARMIRAEVDARYRGMPGRNLAVTEAATTGVVDSLTLLDAPLEPPRAVAAANGVYFGLCTRRARCPYPVRSAAWSLVAPLPRRIALELALRTFDETSVTLVVVALPTTEPVWVVFERDDVLREEAAATLLERLAADRSLPDRLTLPRLFLPLPVLPPPEDTIYALKLFAP